MKISVVTVCFNSEKFIKDAIDSVLAQDYPNIEYIIIDGGSTDNTIPIIESYGNKISNFISQPDKGIYDAMNKGLKLATGKFIAILNSDDFYIHNNVISSVVKRLKKENTDCLYADLIYVNRTDPTINVRYWKSKPFIQSSFKLGWHPAHPTFIVKNNVYKKFGYFSLEFKIAADFELMLRFLEKHKISSTYYPEPRIKMRLGGTTNKSIKNIVSQNIECYKAFKSNNLNVSIFYPIFRLLPKLMQYTTRS